MTSVRVNYALYVAGDIIPLLLTATNHSASISPHITAPLDDHYNETPPPPYTATEQYQVNVENYGSQQTPQQQQQQQQQQQVWINTASCVVYGVEQQVHYSVSSVCKTSNHCNFELSCQSSSSSFNYLLFAFCLTILILFVHRQ